MTGIHAPRATARLDLDFMARTAEEAGRDALRDPSAEAPFETDPAVRRIPDSEAMLVTATRLYRACLVAPLTPLPTDARSRRTSVRFHQPSTGMPKE